MSIKILMDNCCFACGTQNERGLKLEIKESADGVYAKIKVPRWAQGYKNIVHGGIIATILDEMAVWAAYRKGHKSVTGQLAVRIKKAMQTNDEYVATGKVVNIRNGLIHAQAEIINKENETVAYADVKLVKIAD